MSHSINYAVYDRSVSRKAVLAEIQEEVAHESWREGGWYPDSQLKWHDDRVFETEEDAQRFLERYEGTRRGLSRQRRARACPITHSLNSLPRSVTKTCSKILLYAMSFLPGAVTQKRFATVMPVPCQIMVRTMFELPARRERTLFSIRLSKAVALANRAIGMSSTK